MIGKRQFVNQEGTVTSKVLEIDPDVVPGGREFTVLVIRTDGGETHRLRETTIAPFPWDPDISPAVAGSRVKWTYEQITWDTGTVEKTLKSFRVLS